jgi:multiple sugar transport system permease protein
MKAWISPRWRRIFGENLTGYAFITPWLIGFLGFTLWPMMYSFYLSLTKWDVFNPPQFIGLENYFRLLHDPTFWKALRNTIYFTSLAVPAQMTVALFIALLLNRSIPGRGLLRTIYYLPTLIGGAPLGVLWLMLLHHRTGIINRFLAFFGIEGPAWLIDPVWVIPSVVLMTIWGVGGTIVIFLAALQGVLRELYEAAEIDGAGIWARFRYITLPIISPALFFNIVMAVIGSMKVFAPAYVLFTAQGGPQEAGLFYVLYLYRKAFISFEMGYASALAWVLFFLILTLTLLIFKSSELWVYYEREVRR